jgi:hypothetical protein
MDICIEGAVDEVVVEPIRLTELSLWDSCYLTPPRKKPSGDDTTPISDIDTSKFLFPIPEAAVLMSTTIFAVREACRSGRLKYVDSLGHGWLISPAAMQEFIRAAENEEKVA